MATCKDCLHYEICLDNGDDAAKQNAEHAEEECEFFKNKANFVETKYILFQEVWYLQDEFTIKKGEVLMIYFDGTFNNIPKYEIEYNGNVYCEDVVFSTKAEAEQALVKMKCGK